MAARVEDSRLARFDRVERAAHWASALLFVVLMLTALPLYFGSLEAIVGRRALLVQVHTWAGVALPVPLVLSAAGPWGKGLRADLRRINRWSRDELGWLRSLGRRSVGTLGKFNPGQKLNAAFVGGSIVVMLATGSVMRWFQPFPLGWRTGATFVHDALAAAIFAAVAGHVVLALTHPESLRSMLTGKVSIAWARRHAPGWLAEERSGPAQDAAAAGPVAQAAAGTTAATPGPGSGPEAPTGRR